MNLGEYTEYPKSYDDTLRVFGAEINNVLHLQADRRMTLTLTEGKLEAVVIFRMLPPPSDIPVSIVTGTVPPPDPKWQVIDQETWGNLLRAMTWHLVTEEGVQQLIREIRQRIGEGTPLTFLTHADTKRLILFAPGLMLTVSCNSNPTHH